MYVTPFPQLHPQLPCRLRVVPLSRVRVADASSLLTVMSVTYRPLSSAAYSSAVLSWLRTIALLVVFSFIALIVASHPHVYLHMWTRGLVGWLVGWLVGPRAAGCLFVRERVGRVFVGVLVGRWRAWCFVGAWWVLVRPSPGGRVGRIPRARVFT